MSDKKPAIKFKYIFNYGYNPVYVNGAQGGISHRGELVMNFYLERQPLPDSISHEINPNGTIGNQTSEEPEDLKNSLVRFIDSGIILNYESARDLHSWLEERLKEMETIERAKATMKFGESAPGKTAN